VEDHFPAAQKSSLCIIDSLRRSAIFQEYQRAFCDATGLPLTLIDATSQSLPFSCKRAENPFCALVAQTEVGCNSCTKIQEAYAKKIGNTPLTMKCFVGLSDTIVPVKSGDIVLGYLHTGQVFLSEPTRKAFTRTAKLLLKWGTKADVKHLESAYFSARILTRRQYDAVLGLLSVFAKHLSEVSNRIFVDSPKSLPPMIEDTQRLYSRASAGTIDADRGGKARQCNYPIS
jgi:ligand-binding sensor protein